jgi:spore coat protein JC
MNNNVPVCVILGLHQCEYQFTASVKGIFAQHRKGEPVDHTTGIYPVSASGIPFSVMPIASKGDIITDLHEDLAAEQKARTTYDNIMRFADDPDVKDVIRFLRERELVHYQRFGESLRLATDNLDCRNFYAFNPEFDKRQAQNMARPRLTK